MGNTGHLLLLFFRMDGFHFGFIFSDQEIL